MGLLILAGRDDRLRQVLVAHVLQRRQACPAAPRSSRRRSTRRSRPTSPLIEDEISQDETPTAFDAGMGMGLVRPYRWWRHITSDRTFDTQFSEPDSTGRPTRALVTVNATLTGTFNLIVGDTAVGDTARRLVTKPLLDHRTRKLFSCASRGHHRGR